MLDPNIIEHSKSGSGKVAELWMVSLGLKFTDHNDRDDYFMFGEAG